VFVTNDASHCVSVSAIEEGRTDQNFRVDECLFVPVVERIDRG